MRVFPFEGPVESNRRPKGPIRPVIVHWRANGTTPPVDLRPMPDRIPPARGWIEVAAAITIILLLAIIGTGLWGRG